MLIDLYNKQIEVKNKEIEEKYLKTKASKPSAQFVNTSDSSSKYSTINTTAKISTSNSQNDKLKSDKPPLKENTNLLNISPGEAPKFHSRPDSKFYTININENHANNQRNVHFFTTTTATTKEIDDSNNKFYDHSFIDPTIHENLTVPNKTSNKFFSMSKLKTDLKNQTYKQKLDHIKNKFETSKTKFDTFRAKFHRLNHSHDKDRTIRFGHFRFKDNNKDDTNHDVKENKEGADTVKFEPNKHN
ncbi:uncharacterized protein KGF55_005549 [Candida pseudojiufengensis]|uniref:uncharacterized protein n=1 Tax=Candida pseudojiufengensis TaxID=497109 RepID=UPI002224848F|nr:uncharacterized protein KGF55_005549 [Candida pseudojiufengensis]KAI5959059.1 hypothetical protein KGF55_005549 [Candida pseudojiufengensis]